MGMYVTYHNTLSWLLVAHACNPSYLGGNDQEDYGLKPAQAKSWQDSPPTQPMAEHTACHPKLCERLRPRGLWFQANPGKKFVRPPPISMEKS
jgi:hypothetical protein